MTSLVMSEVVRKLTCEGNQMWPVAAKEIEAESEGDNEGKTTRYRFAGLE